MRGEAVESPSNLPSHNIDEESARASMARRGIDDDAVISFTRNCTQHIFDYNVIDSTVRYGMSPAEKHPKLLGAREGDICAFLDYLAEPETGVAIIF